MAIVSRITEPVARESARERGHSPTGDPYVDLPWDGPHAPVVGHALITMVEPHVGHEHAYNRWYEDSHFFNGAMQHPWVFAGRRWVAPVDLQRLRLPADSPVARPLDAGKYLSTYWVTQGRIDELKKWTSASNAHLVSVGDVNRERTHVFTSFQDKAGTVYADPSVPADVFALMDPAPGLVVAVYDAPTAGARDALEDWLLDVHLPQRIVESGPVSSGLVFRVTPPYVGMKPEVFAALTEVANEGRRLTVLWFLREDPVDCWPFFADEIADVRASGLGEVALLAPFRPSKMGTTLYEDRLRAEA